MLLVKEYAYGVLAVVYQSIADCKTLHSNINIRIAYRSWRYRAYPALR